MYKLYHIYKGTKDVREGHICSMHDGSISVFMCHLPKGTPPSNPCVIIGISVKNYSRILRQKHPYKGNKRHSAVIYLCSLKSVWQSFKLSYTVCRCVGIIHVHKKNFRVAWQNVRMDVIKCTCLFGSTKCDICTCWYPTVTSFIGLNILVESIFIIMFMVSRIFLYAFHSEK